MFGFPLLLIPLAVCNIIVFLMPGVSFAASLFTVPLMSGAGWLVALSDALVALGLLLLLLEVQKSARPGGKYVTDHLLAFVIFAGAAVEFMMLPQFANSTFFLLTLIALVDFLSGLALRGRRPKRLRETAVVEPAPAPVVAREASVEPIRPGNSVAQPARIEPVRAVPVPVIPPHTDHPTPEVASTALPRIEPVKVEPVRVEPARVEPIRVEAARVEAARVEPARVEPARVEPARVEPIVDMDPMLGEPSRDPEVDTETRPKPRSV